MTEADSKTRMALEPGSKSPTNPTTDLKKGMWHPHVYRTPPKSPTPFSIDDILKRGGPVAGAALKNAHEVAEEWLRVWQYINNAMQHQKMLQQQSEVESGRDSTESCTPGANSNSGSSGSDEDRGDETQQPLNLSLATTNHTSTKQGFDKYEFNMNSTSHKTGMNNVDFRLNCCKKNETGQDICFIQKEFCSIIIQTD